MNTDQPSADVKAPVTINEADVAHFIATRYAELKPPNWASLSVSRTSYGTSFSIYGSAPGCDSEWVHGSGQSFDAAFAEFTKRMPLAGEALAAKKRAQAAKLLAEADALVAVPAEKVEVAA